MKRKFVKRNEDEKRNQHPGFVSAAIISHPDDAPTEVAPSNQCSKTWRAFFERIHDEENVPIPSAVANAFAERNAEPKWPLNSARKPTRSYSTIFNRTMGSSARNESLSIDTSENYGDNEDENDAEDNGVYSVFTKKVAKNAKASEVKQPAVYSPPKFYSTSTHRSVSKPSSAGRQPLFSKPYALSTNSRILSARSRPLVATSSAYSRPTTSVRSSSDSSLLPELMLNRPLLVFSVLYSASSTRKHKKWENDGFLYFDFFDNQVCLHKLLEKPAIAREPTAPIAAEQIEEEYTSGFETIIGGYEVQIQEKYYSNVTEDVKTEHSNENDELADKRAEIEDDRHFFDKRMEDYLVKTEEGEGRGELLTLDRPSCEADGDDSRSSRDSMDRQQSDTSTYSVDREIKIEDN